MSRQVAKTPVAAMRTSASHGVLQRKCACGTHTVAGGECTECGKSKSELHRRNGNQGVSGARFSLSHGLPMQARLAIGATDDPLEQEADRIADQVLAAPARSGVGRTALGIQRFARQPTAAAETAPASVDRVLASPGRPLDVALQQDMGQRFGHDFSQVRVHSDAAAEQSARDVNAHAYTVGHNMVFGAGRFAADTREGRRLIAHELTHVVQQSAADGIGAEQAGSGIVRREPERSGAAGEPAQSTTPEASLPKRCGPDVTDWFVTQVNTAMTDPAVLAVKASLATANWFASYFRLNAGQLGEAGGTLAITGKQTSLGSRAPAANPTINQQLAEGKQSVGAVIAAAPSALDSPTTITPFPSPSTGAAIAMTSALAAAALGWKALVNHGAAYDFKAHIMNFPKGASCPDGCPQGQVGIVTLCPGANPQNCYESDVPGNLFYSVIGKFIGWSKLTLQLGSQYAELTDDKRPKIDWDSPTDTKAIDLAYKWPLPLSRAALCGSIGPARGKLGLREGCQDCLEPFP